MRTVDGIYQALAADFFTGTGQQTSASGDLAARFYAVAAQIYALYVQADWTRRQCFPQSAEGEQLDAHAQLRGLSRRQAAKATGAVRFYVDEERTFDTQVPEGTVCMTADGVRFVTTQGGSVTAGGHPYRPECGGGRAGGGGQRAGGQRGVPGGAPGGGDRLRQPGGLLQRPGHRGGRGAAGAGAGDLPAAGQRGQQGFLRAAGHVL